MKDLGRILFAISFAILGGLLIGAHGFGDVWPTVPKWMPARAALTMLSGLVLVASSIALLVPRTARAGAMVLAGFLVVEILVLKLPHVVAHPLVVGVYEDGAESLACLGGAWTIIAMLYGGTPAQRRPGQIAFALALLPFGLAHFVYLELTAPLIPSWLPFHVVLAYLTGAANIAAGLGILLGVRPWLAATLEAVMVSLFTLLVWVPIVAGAPTKLSNWSEICLSAAISGAAWAVARSFAVTKP
jgi:uncharacterized membrane protein